MKFRRKPSLSYINILNIKCKLHSSSTLRKGVSNNIICPHGFLLFTADQLKRRFVQVVLRFTVYSSCNTKSEILKLNQIFSCVFLSRRHICESTGEATYTENVQSSFIHDHSNFCLPVSNFTQLTNRTRD